jgi:hypothetical protein
LFVHGWWAERGEEMEAQAYWCAPAMNAARANDARPAVRGMFVAVVRGVFTMGPER